MLAALKAGKSPNIDTSCNRIIKFNVLLDYVRNHLKADILATGHYATNSIDIDREAVGGAKLMTAFDSRKDQTFFLSQ
ncbi:MAG: hypothetical protein MHPSP_003909, partial [Paramarteilia canceri]